ncbi:N-acetylglucosamine kinase [Nonomuraea angiospora]|uniref:N-acetylglucosamine kinase-like BadF-type ATPase n=1 Tax=Nonomuraea angiospora TaxID=46172 RepID=A0ABR9ME33_9ACTN|nr:BadF/BadG/BcrA/BcrD ATPase family protein [Nonomuraea angiospora]MBE1591172.1 N-acetylglucosamine kinase-like BadF-type ATPase [Nonomuraea angiospora]
MTESLVVGVDAGATSTRVAVHALDGTRVGYARAGAGNPTAHGLDKAVANVAAALAGALGEHDGRRVVASLTGVAGQVAEMVPEVAKVWAGHGIAEEPRYMGDTLIAYAAGSPEPAGSLLLSGTGAVAARIVDFRLDAVADGLGWLLGDEGSGFWIGRRAVMALIGALDRGMPVPPDDRIKDGGVLAELVVEHFLGDDRPASPRAAADRIVRLAQADHMRLAALSSLVSRAAAAGDETALKITQDAADHLVATLRRVHVSGPVVLAGSVLTSEGPVRQAVVELLADRNVTTAGDAAGAAAWLAARDLLPEGEAKALHAAFTAVSP